MPKHNLHSEADLGMSSHQEIRLGNYVILQPLDAGLNCRVYLASNIVDGGKYALKLPNVQNEEHNKQILKREQEIARVIAHPNIVRFHECHSEVFTHSSEGLSTTTTYSVLELLPNGELFHYIDLTGKLEEEIARFYFLQLLDALQHCHSRGVAHRDVKPSNLMLDQSFNLKLIDFGFGVPCVNLSNDMVGTTEFMAPEIHKRVPYSPAGVDVFSAGVTLFCMLTGKIPFGEATEQNSTYQMIAQGLRTGFWELHSKLHGFHFSSQLQDLIIGMLQSDPSQRPSLSQIRQHAWCVGPSLNHEQVYSVMMQRKLKIASLIKQKHQLAKSGGTTGCQMRPSGLGQQMAETGGQENEGTKATASKKLRSNLKKNLGSASEA